jgi:hypothetical protein
VSAGAAAGAIEADIVVVQDDVEVLLVADGAEPVDPLDDGG